MEIDEGRKTEIRKMSDKDILRKIVEVVESIGSRTQTLGQDYWIKKEEKALKEIKEILDVRN